SIYTLTLHDALPIWLANGICKDPLTKSDEVFSSTEKAATGPLYTVIDGQADDIACGVRFVKSDTWQSIQSYIIGVSVMHPERIRSEEHTSELQSREK